MQFLQIAKDEKLKTLIDKVGSRNVDSILHINNVPRTPNIGKSFYDTCKNVMDTEKDVTWQRKVTVLNTMTDDSDVFEHAALLGQSAWKVLSSINTFPGMLKIPESVVLPSSVDVLGNSQSIGNRIYRMAMRDLETPPHSIDPSIFNEYSSIKPSRIIDNVVEYNPTFQWFRIPWGEVTLYSSLSNTAMDFPVFPEEVSDSVKANYTTMPDILYQYEPWQLYTGSGPRVNTYEFAFHRDMWTGDHTDGKANELIRFCMANCYPEYNGSAVNTSTVSLYIHGDCLISGILTDVTVDWDGPLGHDMWYLNCKVALTITEVSKQALNYDVVRKKPLIG